MFYFKTAAIVTVLLFCGLPSFGAAQTALSEVLSDTLPVVREKLQVGAGRFDQYIHLLKNKKVALAVNQSSLVGKTHLLDTLLGMGVEVVQIFSPEHGFRGAEDAGASIADGKDGKTGVPILSLYGKNKKPSPEQMKGIDLIIFDIQDVGTRFYTYISTMHYLMEACAETDKPLIVLDRPNPNGHYTDGPLRKKNLQSFVGMHPIPIVHGLTVGELAQMIVGEGWLGKGKKCVLTVVPCLGYNHQTPYDLPVKPSPNLPNAQSIALYPSLCLFEGTGVSIGRGTDFPFQTVGSPDFPETGFSFVPEGKPGAGKPLLQGQKCKGYDLRKADRPNRIELSWLIEFYQKSTNKNTFFNSYFDKLSGDESLRLMIQKGIAEKDIRDSWASGLKKYRAMRAKYLIYGD